MWFSKFNRRKRTRLEREAPGDGRKERVEFNCREFAQANWNARQESVLAVQSALVFAPWAPGGTEIDAAAR